MHIVTAGNIGVGKTTLTRLLAKQLDAKAYFDKPLDNHYLQDFYKDMRSWTFHFQMSLMISRVQKIKEISQEKGFIIQDTNVYEDGEIYAPTFNSLKILQDREFELIMEAYHVYLTDIKPPDLLIFLKASNSRIMERIKKSNESLNVNPDYIKTLNSKFDKWIEKYSFSKYIVVDTDQVDITDSEGLKTVISQIAKAVKS